MCNTFFFIIKGAYKPSNQYYPGVYNGGNSITSSSSGGMRTPLSSCRKNLALAPCGDGDRCIEGSVVVCGTLLLILRVVLPSRLFCNPVVRGRRDDEGEMNAGDENGGRSGIKGGIPPLLDVLVGSEG